MKKTEDVFLWQILALIGLNFINYRLGRIAKFFRTLFITALMMSLLYFALVNLSFIGKQMYKKSIVSFLLSIFSGLMWYIAFSKRKDISYIVLHVYQKRKCYRDSKKTVEYIIISLPIFIIAIPCVSCIFNLTKNFENFEVAYLTFGYEIQSKTWKRVFILYVEFADFGLCSAFPFYLTTSICILYYRCSEILSGYKTLLRIQLYTVSKGTVNNYVEFFHIVNLLRKLNKTFTHLSFLIIIYHLETILNVILKTPTEGLYESSIVHIVNLAYYGLCSIIVLVYFTICCSLIPENLLEIKAIVKNFININRYSQHIPEQNLFYLLRIENEDIVYITVCGMFHVTRSYILTALGVMLTYGLLIINLKL